MSISQKELARHLAISTCTVSKALRDDPIVARATRDRVVAAAKELGYRHNPTLSAIAASRFRVTDKRMTEVIAFLHDGRVKVQNRASIAAGREQADRLGYDLQPFNLTEFETASHLDRTLYSRGIRGLIFGTIFRPPFPLDLRWERYAIVGCETNVNPFPFDEIRVSWLAAVENALHVIAGQGYRRIAPVLNTKISRHRDAMGQIAGVEGTRYLSRIGDRLLPTFDFRTSSDKDLARYVARRKPDAYLVQSYDRYLQLGEIHRQLDQPTPPGACIYMSPDHPDYRDVSGILANDRALGIEAVRQINSMLREGRFGQPATAVQTVVQHDFRLTDSLRGPASTSDEK